MEKVKVTKEQAEAIERWADKIQLVKAKLFGFLNHGEDESIAEMTVDELIKALYIGYEVEPEFKVGDWVVNANGTIGKITNINEFGEFEGFWEKTEMLCEKDNFVRHATPEEIAAEKERRWWAKLDRGVNEYRMTDIVKHVGMQGLYEVVNVFDTVHVELTKDFCDTSFTTTVDKLTLVCPAENRLDGDFDEEN